MVLKIKGNLSITGNHLRIGYTAVVIAIVLSWSFKQILSLGSDASGGDYFGSSFSLKEGILLIL